MKDFWWIDECVVVVKNEDGSWSEMDNGDAADGLTYAQAVELALKDTLYDEDIMLFHDGTLTKHFDKVLGQFPYPFDFQIWGSRTGREPLSIKVTDLSDSGKSRGVVA